MFWKRNLRPEDAPEAGTFRNVDELIEAYRAIGVTCDKTVYVYCNSGHMATVGWFVLKVVLGSPDVRLYDGSWIDWSSRPDAPKESGKPGEAKARAAADALTRDLQSRLVAEISAGGPPRAVAVCAEIAPKAPGVVPDPAVPGERQGPAEPFSEPARRDRKAARGEDRKIK